MNIIHGYRCVACGELITVTETPVDDHPTRFVVSVAVEHPGQVSEACRWVLEALGDEIRWEHAARMAAATRHLQNMITGVRGLPGRPSNVEFFPRPPEAGP